MGVPVTGSLGRGVTCAVVEVAAGAAQPEIDVAVDGGEGTSEIDGPWPGYPARMPWGGAPTAGRRPAVGVAGVTDGPSPPPPWASGRGRHSAGSPEGSPRGT